MQTARSETCAELELFAARRMRATDEGWRVAGDGWRDEEVGGLHPPYGRQAGPRRSIHVQQALAALEPGPDGPQ